MSKLIDAYRTNPTDANRERLAKYMRRHPMAVVMATDAELSFLREVGLLP